jgi:NAD(P)-dependent dehydrogenase (short-subunit alcohol dehydrogenase family)
MAAAVRQLRVCLTGGTAGIGLQLLKQLCSEGHEVVLLARSHARADAAIRTLSPAQAQLVKPVMCSDLADFASVRAAAAEVLRTGPAAHLDVLILNAGVLHQRLQHINGA